MSHKAPNYHNIIYSIVFIIGITTSVGAIYISSSSIDDFEHNTNRIHRLITASQVELDTLESELSSIEESIADINHKIKSKTKNQTKLKQEFFNLKQNISDLRTDIAEKQKLLISLNLLKTSTLSQIKSLFWINSFLLVIGTLLILIGLSALVFKLEIFQDRRNKKRSDPQKTD